MNFSATFIARPVATILLAIGLLIAGSVAYAFLPVASLPSVDIPTIVVFASRPGADPETMATSIAAPLERRLGEIAGVTEVTSVSSTGSTSIIVQFNIDRPIDAAAHDVQAAINAAVADLPSDLPTAPYFRKYNPAEAPVMTIALTSDTLSRAQLYDAADSILGQRLSQVEGVSQVQINGAEKPAVRVRLDPERLAATGVAAQDVFNTIRSANVLQPTGSFSGRDRAEGIAVNGQLSQASEYEGLIIKRNGRAVLRVRDVASVVNSVANVRLAAWDGKKPAVLLSISKEAGANVIDTVDRIEATLPQLLEWMPQGVKVSVISDRTGTIRASVSDVQYTLLLTVSLVLMVMFVFIRRMVPTIAAGVTVPLSIGGTLAGMWLMGFTLDNFSLIALTVSVGFVVDDAIVMIENIVRHAERGATPMRAALEGARQIGFTVVSISLSLIAVFIPLIFMGGILGRLFHEFAMTLTLAIFTSAIVSLTLTPMICGHFMKHAAPLSGWRGGVDRVLERSIAGMQRVYEATLDQALAWPRMMLGVMLATIVATVWLYGVVPKGFMPIEDTGLLFGMSEASPDVSFQAMSALQRQAVDVLLADPAVASVGSTIGVTTGFASLNRGQMTIQLKPYDQRHISSEGVIARLREKLGRIAGMQTSLFSVQDLRSGGQRGSQFQIVLLSENLEEMREWTQKLEDRLREIPGIADASSDQDRASPQQNVVIDRAAAARLGVSVSAVDDALNNAFSQRQVSTIYTDRNQYRVVLEVDPQAQTDPSTLSRIYVAGANDTQVLLSAVARFDPGYAPLSVSHHGSIPAGTLNFNLAGKSLGDATALIAKTAQEMRMPETVHWEFAGNAKLLQQSLDSEPLLILAALVAIYIVLGVLYESLIHPITILSTLPSAGLGALLAILVTGGELSIISIIAIVLLLGIVKKNGIMLVDFALEAEREHGLDARAAIRAACMERFRPIMMTTLAALLGAMPLALAFGTGAELRRPLGIAVAGGLIVSQALTLYTTPVVYLALEKLAGGRRKAIRMAPAE